MTGSKISISDTIRAIRGSLTQAQFAALLNNTNPKSLKFHLRDISRYETGKCIPPGDKLLKITGLQSGGTANGK